MPQPASLAPNFCRSVHRVTSHLTKWSHCIPTLSVLPPAHSRTFSVRVVLTSAQQMQLMWQRDACDTANALKRNCALAPSLLLCYAECNKMLNQSLYWSSLSAFMGCRGQVVTALETEASRKVCHNDSSGQLLQDFGTTISHQSTELGVTLSPLNSFTTYNWGCFSPTSTTLFTL